MGDKRYFFDMLENVKKKISFLSEDNYIKAALLDGVLNIIESKIIKLQENELAHEYYQPLFLFVYNNDISIINELNNDLLLLKDNSSDNSFQGLISFLRANESKEGVRIWQSGLFEVFIKSLLLKKFPKNEVKLDKKLPNGKNLDAAIKLNNKCINFEITILSSSDEDYYVSNQYNEALKNNSNEALIRPGKYDATNSKSPSLYYDKFRVFRKIYDKITNERLDVDKSQMSPNEPNVLLLFIGDAISTLNVSPGVGWAFDKLFASQPTSENNSFLQWVENEINRLNLGKVWYRKNVNKVISAPRKLSSIIIFDGCNGSIIESRINYNANKENKISHKEMGEIEEIFKERPIYL